MKRCDIMHKVLTSTPCKTVNEIMRLRTRLSDAQSRIEALEWLVEVQDAALCLVPAYAKMAGKVEFFWIREAARKAAGMEVRDAG